VILFGFMAIVPKRDTAPTLQALSTAVRQALVVTGIQGKRLADAMRLSPSHLSRQLNEQGINLWRLLGAGREFWLKFMPSLVELVGLTRDDILTMFRADTDAKRDEREKKQDDRIAELERQLAEVLRRLPEPAKDEHQHVA